MDSGSSKTRHQRAALHFIVYCIVGVASLMLFSVAQSRLQEQPITWNGMLLSLLCGTALGLVMAFWSWKQKTRAPLFQREAEKLQNVIYRIAQAAHHTKNLEDLYETVHECIQEVMPADNFYIALYDEETDQLSFPLFIDEHQKDCPTREGKKGLTEYALSQGRSLLVTGQDILGLIEEGEIERRGELAAIWLGVPLFYEGKTIGVMAVQHYSNAKAYGEKERQIMEFVSSQVAHSIDHKRSSEALQESEKWYRTLFNASPDGIEVIDDKGFIRDCNLTHQRILGYDYDEIVGKHTSHFFSEESRPLFKAKFPMLKANGYADAEIVITTNVGDDIPVWRKAQANISPSGEFLGAVSYNRNISDRIKAKQDLEEQVKNMAALHAIDTAITSQNDLNRVLQIVVEQVWERLEVDAVAVLLYDEASTDLHYVAEKGFKVPVTHQSEIHIGAHQSGNVALSGRPLFLKNVYEEASLSRRSERFYKQEGFISYLGIPLLAKDSLKGVLEVFHRSPIDPPPTWFDFLDSLAKQTAIAIDNTFLFEKLNRSSFMMELAYETTLEGWAKALEIRDYETKGHSTRVVPLTIQLAETIGVPYEGMTHIRRGALLHDIGKLGIPDEVLLKPGALDKEERRIMQLHPRLGHEMVQSIPFLKPSLDVLLYHHERWDGKGYPEGLKGEDIPFFARLFSIVDVWDALISDRPYRKGWPREKVLSYIQECSGTLFDPKIVKAFLGIIKAQNKMPPE